MSASTTTAVATDAAATTQQSGASMIDISERLEKAKLGVDEDFIRARVTFELALKTAAGNHAHFTTCSFKGCQLTRDKGWMKQLLDALVTNTTCTELDLSESTLTDGALQQLAATLAVPSRMPKLKKLCIGGNPQLSKMGETVAQGLCKLRAGLELSLGDGVEAAIDGFVCEKQLVEGKSSWWNGDLKTDQHNEFWCPEEVMAAVGRSGEKKELRRAAQTSNGVKYRLEIDDEILAKFEIYNSTGNLVLLELLKNVESEGVEV